jgi:hypothetical protein
MVGAKSTKLCYWEWKIDMEWRDKAFWGLRQPVRAIEMEAKGHTCLTMPLATT